MRASEFPLIREHRAQRRLGRRDWSDQENKRQSERDPCASHGFLLVLLCVALARNIRGEAQSAGLLYLPSLRCPCYRIQAARFKRNDLSRGDSICLTAPSVHKTACGLKKALEIVSSTCVCQTASHGKRRAPWLGRLADRTNNRKRRESEARP